MILTISLLCLLSISTHNVYADTTITWDNPTYFVNSGDILGIGEFLGLGPVNFTVTDTNLANNTQIDTIDVLLTSSIDSKELDKISLTLIETSDDGVFQSQNFVLVEPSAIFKITDTPKIVVVDPGANMNSTKIETLSGLDGSAVASSSSFPDGIFIDLTETGQNTGIFDGILRFSTTNLDMSTNTILVKKGDTITASYKLSTSPDWTNGLISPNPNDIGVIRVVPFGTIMANYNNINGIANIASDKGRCIDCSISFTALDISLTGGKCTGDCGPPTLGVNSNDRRIVDGGFSYNDNSIDVQYFYTPYPLITTNVGEKNIIKLKIYEDQGPQHIKHVEVGFGLKDEDFSKSKAIIEWDKKFDETETVTIFDPENILDDDSILIKIKEDSCGTSVDKAQCLIMTIDHIFREPLEYNMIGTYIWDFQKNGWQNYFNDGIKITGNSLNPPDQYTIVKNGKHILTKADKDVAVDENGNTWRFDQTYNTWRIDYTPKEIIPDKVTMHGIDRNNNMFKAYCDNQILLAEQTFNKIVEGKTIQNPDFGKNYNESIQEIRISRADDTVLQQQIHDEKIRTKELFSILYQIEYKH